VGAFHLPQSVPTVFSPMVDVMIRQTLNG
jgi:hypothetical protein